MRKFGLVLFLSLLTINAIASESSSKNSEQVLEDRKNSVLQSVNKISSYGASDALEEINENIYKFNKVSKLVSQANHVDDVIYEVADSLGEIAQSYRNIAKKKNDIFNVHTKELDSLEGIEKLNSNSIRDLQQKRKALLEDVSRMERTLTSSVSETQKQKDLISIQGHKSVIKSLEAQELIWVKFNEAQEKLIVKLRANSDSVGFFFHVLDVNAEVYQEAATTVKMRRSAKLALENLSNLVGLQDVISEMSNNWTGVDVLIQEISSADFRIE